MTHFYKLGDRAEVMESVRMAGNVGLVIRTLGPHPPHQMVLLELHLPGQSGPIRRWFGAEDLKLVTTEEVVK